LKSLLKFEPAILSAASYKSDHFRFGLIFIKKNQIKIDSNRPVSILFFRQKPAQIVLAWFLFGSVF